MKDFNINNQETKDFLATMQETCQELAKRVIGVADIDGSVEAVFSKSDTHIVTAKVGTLFNFLIEETPIEKVTKYTSLSDVAASLKQAKLIHISSHGSKEETTTPAG